MLAVADDPQRQVWHAGPRQADGPNQRAEIFGRRQAPDDRDIAEVIALVKSRADTDALLRK